MKITTYSLAGLATGALFLLASPAIAQMSGTSHPESLDDDITVAAPQKNTVPVAQPAPQPAVQEVYVAPAPTAHPRGLVRSRPAEDPDAGIVTSYPYIENALSEGTQFRARLVGPLSTQDTKAGSHFIAILSHNVEHNGKVILPAGASVEGRVTQVRSGKRITGGAAMHLEPESVTLPDGTQYRISARLIDLDSGHNSHVNDEGTIVGGNHTKGHVVTLAATTGGGAVTGAVLGGGVGAAVGAGIGAGVGTVLWLNQDRQQTLEVGSELVFTLNRPMDLTPANTWR